MKLINLFEAKVKFKRISNGVYESEDGKWLVNNIDTPDYGVYKYDGKKSELVTTFRTAKKAMDYVNSVTK